MTSRVEGLSEAEILFEGLADDAKESMGQLLTEVALQGLAQQQAATPVDTGAVKLAETAQVQVDQLRARMGLLDMNKGRGRLFYAIPLDKGIAAQTVTVHRRRARGRKLAGAAVVTYSLPIKARAGVGFIEAPDLAVIADPLMAAFWERVSAKEASA